MADLNFQFNLGISPAFQNRVMAAVLNACQAVTAEVVNDAQVLTATGATAGTFTLATVPGVGNASQTFNGTTTSASAAVTGLASTHNLFVGQAVSGAGVPAGTTVAGITSASAVTLSANATASATVPLTFSGSPNVVIPFSATAGDVAALLAAQPAIGPTGVTASGGPLNTTPVTVTFCGPLGGQPLKLMTVAANSLTGATPTVTRGTVGVAVASHAQRQAFVNAFLRNPNTYLTPFAVLVAGNFTVQADFTAAGALASGKDEATAANDLQFVVNGAVNTFALSS
jgi:hypothetical protein